MRRCICFLFTRSCSFGEVIASAGLKILLHTYNVDGKGRRDNTVPDSTGYDSKHLIQSSVTDIKMLYPQTSPLV